MDLLALSKAIKTTNETNHAVLLYGQPKSGKTRLAGTAAKIPEFKRIFWFDLENGSETLLNMDLTDEELQKITIFKIRDTRDNPIAIETLLKAITSNSPEAICDTHGKIDCVECRKAGRVFTKWHTKMCNHDDLVVIDSGSQLGDSALGAACIGQPGMFKPTFDEYGMVNKWLGDIMSVVQQAAYTNFLVITHEIALEDDEGKDRIFPLMGSKAFSMKCGKYFGTVAYLSIKLNKHVAGSSSTYKQNVITGSRVKALLERSTDPSMRDIFVTGGILKPLAYTHLSSAEVAAITINTAQAETKISSKSVTLLPEAGKGGLAAILAAKKAAANP